jgi:hypothetical protein
LQGESYKVSTPNKFAAVDVGVLLAIEAGDEEAESSIDSLRRRGFYFLVTETPLQELSDLCNDSGSEVASHAKNTLVQITNWGFLTPPLSAVQMGIAERVANTLVESCLSDGAACLDDGLAITEAALNNCKLLLTKRHILCGPSKFESINLTLVSFDLSLVLVATPKEIIESLA